MVEIAKVRHLEKHDLLFLGGLSFTSDKFWGYFS
jgi:hypothetical protein